MSERESNVEFARRGFEAFASGNLDELLELLDSEVEIYVPIELPGAGTYRGHDGYLRWSEEWMEAWEEFEIEPQEYEPFGERHVVVPIVQRGRGKGSGIEVEARLAYMFEVRGGIGIAVHLYPTREEAVRAAEEREAGT
jgi:ketosteroid isomerase-like protein